MLAPPPTNNICAGNIDLLGNSAVEDIDEQSEVTVTSEAVVGQNAEQLVGTQEGPQALAQVGAQRNVDLCNRDSNFQVGNLTERVSERNARLHRMESSMDILLKRREPNIDSANSQMYIVDPIQSLGMVQRVHTEGLSVINYLCAGKDGAVRSDKRS